ANRVLAVDPAGGLALENGVAAGAEVVELVKAAGVGDDGAADRAGLVHAIQDNGDARDPGLARLLDAVVEAAHAHVGVDVAGQARRLEFAEVVVGHVAGAQGKRDDIDARRVVQDDAVARLLAVEVAGRLGGLVDHVVAGLEAVVGDVLV